ncbi:AI-2E family transporter [Dissulfurirhabdus thermomarina]|uniref:AI-2E family transporter n=1 Tax=Dissulfurirhabdus thermomarina TaxID=1765737 RepID=A0A6N9TMD9_DISTH|nr:AI-2E family transporter [Dissulfurirhabdus thermomarina]NDY42208.1 AI-2E family transporter [Dissulfurirhabdus thermomarina]NMX22664.1 AI-2E family transporter [Dissulfurirhabdus thermomarina]
METLDRCTDNERLVALLALALAGLILAAGLRLFLPFFEPIVWAVVLALFFHPAHRWLRERAGLGEGVAALLMCLFIAVFLMAPGLFLLGSLTAEVLRVYNDLQEALQTTGFTVVPDAAAFPVLHGLALQVLEALGIREAEVHAALVDLSKWMGQFVLHHGTAVFRNIVTVFATAALTLVALYYFFRDGERMLRAFEDLLPLPRREIANFASVTSDVLSATLYGNLMTGAIQGVLGVFILWVLGFSAPLLWGLVLGLATFIPMVGTALVWVPATLYLFVTGAYLKGAVLLVFSVLVISSVDYFLRPYLISGRTQLHSLFLFFSILGGLQAFGPLGLVLGPIIVGLCVSILEIYRRNFLGRGEEAEA